MAACAHVRRGQASPPPPGQGMEHEGALCQLGGHLPNDDFPAIELPWVRPFASRQGSYHPTGRRPVRLPHAN
ncbi:MAG: hypothetical protein RMK29_20870 [Myxococcales bacterium]|nr:hypothetical protein [Myxococcota bacterium]MDW8284166.1 hypothetical protein [Myxococcales bacterium]